MTDQISDVRKISAVKRTTLIVRDLERSLRFYRDILGMKILYRGDVTNPGASELAGMPCDALRMVVLEADNEPTGKVGLMQIVGAGGALRAVPLGGGLHCSEAILVIATRHIDELAAAISAERLPIVSGPLELQVPGRGTVREMFARDPDGVLVNLTQRLFSEPAAQTPASRALAAVSDFMGRLAARDLAGASSLLAPGFSMTISGGHRFMELGAFVAFSSTRNRSVRKHQQRADVCELPRGGQIEDMQVWSDPAERRDA
jgi:catechol 2,3-dioxygenase-like lactoylglutathione lyase family enzyme